MGDAGYGLHCRVAGHSSEYVELLTNMLQGAMYNIMEVTDMREGEIKLWSKGEVEESPEEESTPVPVAFGPVLSFMERILRFAGQSCRRAPQQLCGLS